MKHELDIKPYNKIFINCKINPLISLLCNVNESFLLLPVVNYYSYLFPLQNAWPDINITQQLDHILENNLDIQYCKFVSRANCIEEIQNLLTQGMFVLVFVDLYYWNNENFMYRNHHMEHFSLITGFDDDKKEIYAFEDDINSNYKKIIIPYKDAFDAINLVKDQQVAGYLIINVKKDIKDYDFSLRDILNNANIIIGSLNSYNIRKFSLMKRVEEIKEYYIHLISILKKMSNRWYANKSLFAYMYENKLITLKQFEFIIKECDYIITKYDSIRHLIIKSNMEEKAFKLEKITNMWNDCMKRELTIWCYLIEETYDLDNLKPKDILV